MRGDPDLAQDDLVLTDHEGTLLALVARAGPITTYQIAKVYEESPVTHFNTSKGKLYPLVRRLQGRGLIESAPVAGDARKSETHTVTDAGRRALKRWVLQIRPQHLLLDDPLRTKVQSFDLLDQDERIKWLVSAKTGLRLKLEELEDYRTQVTVPFHEFVHDNAVRSIQSRMDWLDVVLEQLVNAGERPDR